MEAKHTPGPWTVTDDGLFVIAGNDRTGAPISIACSPSPHDWRKVDANLIAAAPELLGALVFNWNIIRQLRAEAKRLGLHEPSLQEAEEKAEKAIAKVRGGA